MTVETLFWVKNNFISAAMDGVDPEILKYTDERMQQTIAAIDAESDYFSRECKRYKAIISSNDERIRENDKKVSSSKRMPLLIANVVEVIDIDETALDTEQEVVNDVTSLHAASSKDRRGPVIEGVIIKTTNRQQIFLEKAGLVARGLLRPNDLIAVNKDTYFIYERLPNTFDGRVKAMEVVDRPVDTFDDLGGVARQVKELQEAMLLPLTKPHLFREMGIQATRGALLWGPPGGGKTAAARALANACNCCFLQLCATQLIQMYIGDGSAMVSETFELGKAKIEEQEARNAEAGLRPGDAEYREPGCIIYIDEIDAIGTRRFDSDGKGDREVARTLLTFLSCLDGFDSNDRIKVLASTNRIDVLDPALTRSGRFDKKIQFTEPNLAGRIEILRIHSKKTRVGNNINFEEIAKSCDGYSGAMLKGVCMEAGLVCLRRGGGTIDHEDYVEAVGIIGGRKEGEMAYFI